LFVTRNIPFIRRSFAELPKAASLASCTAPSLNTTFPEKLLLPDRTSVPPPFFSTPLLPAKVEPMVAVSVATVTEAPTLVTVPPVSTKPLVENSRELVSTAPLTVTVSPIPEKSTPTDELFA
jgi:hypothetical protein